ncbi:MAG: amidase [Nocardioides sp.]|uniref:amidase n=1 Tax=Nocardioides sp. TaxID=35761 RepID=UPI0039E6D735
MTHDLAWLSAHDLARAYRAREVSPVEAVEASLERLEQVQPLVNAFVTVTAEQARQQAREAERRLVDGDDLPALYGVPIAVKDLTDTAGVRTTYGCVAYAEHVPTEDGIAWARLKAAGAILIGKTTTPEFGALGVTESKLTGTTGTPWDPSRSSGGSSGGSAAATAAGVVAVSWGSDGGGSIRVPSSLCGTVGVKPTSGRIPHRDNAEPDSTEGPITRTVVDAALMMDVAAGPHPRDHFALPALGGSYVEAALTDGDLSGMRIAANAEFCQGPLDPETRRIFNASLDDLRTAGAVVEEVDIQLPPAVDFFVPYWGPGYITLVDAMRTEGLEVWPLMSMVADRARMLSPAQISSAVREWKTSIYNAYADVFEDFDLVVTPTTPIPAFPHAGDKGGVDVVDGVEIAEPGGFLHSHTESPSHACLPAISVPCGFTADDLPVGLQMIGPLYADMAVIAAAARYQRVTAWHERHPTL